MSLAGTNFPCHLSGSAFVSRAGKVLVLNLCDFQIGDSALELSRSLEGEEERLYIFHACRSGLDGGHEGCVEFIVNLVIGYDGIYVACAKGLHMAAVHEETRLLVGSLNGHAHTTR